MALFWDVCIPLALYGLKLLEKETPRIYERNKESELIKQKRLHEKHLNEINNLKIEIVEAMVENENTEEIEQWTKKHRATDIRCTNWRDREQNRYVEERERSLWCRARTKKNSKDIRRRKKNPRNADGDEEERREGEKRREERRLNDCKFYKTKLPKLVIPKFDGTHFD